MVFVSLDQTCDPARVAVKRNCVMHSPPPNNRGSSSRSRQHQLDGVSSHAFPQPIVSPTFLQSAPDTPPQAFPSFPIPQYGYTSDPSTNLLSSSWQRPRATSSYALEAPTLAFPEPQIHRSTSTRAPSPPPRASQHDLDRAPISPPPLPPRKSITHPKPHSTKVALR
jgi:hypothetical protein